GLNGVAADLTEGAGGDQWLQNLTVGVDQVYMLYVSNVSANSSSANITFSNTGILTCGFFLPVELLQFDAKAAEAHVDVLWTTVSETSSAWFNVQRSADGEHFTQIGRVNAAGNSVQTLDYSLKDAAPLPGLSYYRLEQVDQDGTVTYSHAVPVYFQGRTPAIALHPTPAMDLVYITLDLPDEGTLSWTVIDQSGRLAKQGTTAGTPGTYQFELPLQGLEAGAYQVELSQGNTRIGRTRFIKQ
ncbi:MAG: T9SS type A sorting domain-containing protein, partial [Flavobacteriales bacterium]